MYQIRLCSTDPSSVLDRVLVCNLLRHWTLLLDGDVEKWIRDFELFASCNGIKENAYMVTTLGALLTGRARAAYDLNLERNQALDYGILKSALVAEFSMEGDRDYYGGLMVTCRIQW
ncbi:unnamed protein product [Echinostoma caproni]|uniref:AAA_6 domain-containing protein n=1 Tax=Echinostoma caproni TaxID=27848 RepID=A0A183B9R8_9TREM|nr:unnamed protein product [Echinostoma caproni]